MTTTVFVYTLNRLGMPGRWSRYVFPFDLQAYAQLNDTLYVRAGDDVLRVDPQTVQDFVGDTQVPARTANFPGIVQWAWLDDGQPGVMKKFLGVDLVGDGTPSIALGWDQSNPATFTTDYRLPPDTIPGALIPLAIMAPSCSVRVSYAGGEKWKLQGLTLWLDDQRPMAR